MTTSGHLVFLSKTQGAIRSCAADGSGFRTIIEGYEGKTPDGVQVDLVNGWIYWTVMGTPSENDGCIERCDFKDGANLKHIILPGQTFTPKQLQLEPSSDRLYWCDREGMRVMRSSTSGNNIEVLIQTGSTAKDRLDETKHCVGITLDVPNKLLYWTQKGPSKGSQGTIVRASLDITAGETPSTRSDIEVLFDHLPEPIDLELDVATQELYWTDRGEDKVGGNSLNRAYVGDGQGVKPKEYEILQRGFHEAIGVALDLKRKRAFVADLGGGVYTMGLDGSNEETILQEHETGELGITGIAFVNE